MTPSGYIWAGIGSGALGVLVLMATHQDDGLEDAIARTELAMGNTPASSGDTTADVIAFLLIAAGIVMVLIGAIGAGVKAGQRD